MLFLCFGNIFCQSLILDIFSVIQDDRIHHFLHLWMIENRNLRQTNETHLLGVVVNDQLNWHSNTEFIIKKANKRMIILHNLFKFSLPMQEMITIYILYIRFILESSAVVWHSSITKSEDKLRLKLCQAQVQFS